MKNVYFSGLRNLGIGIREGWDALEILKNVVAFLV